jgi:hypothetical protein
VTIPTSDDIAGARFRAGTALQTFSPPRPTSTEPQPQGNLTSDRLPTTYSKFLIELFASLHRQKAIRLKPIVRRDGFNLLHRHLCPPLSILSRADTRLCSGFTQCLTTIVHLHATGIWPNLPATAQTGGCFCRGTINMLPTLQSATGPRVFKCIPSSSPYVPSSPAHLTSNIIARRYGSVLGQKYHPTRWPHPSG